MPEPADNTVINQGTTPNNDSSSTKDADAGTHQNPTFDTSKLTDADFDTIFKDDRLYKHSRFKELTEAKKERDALIQKQRLAEEESLKEQNKWKELYEKTTQEKEQLNNSIKEARINAAIERQAVKLGVVDSDAALKLLDQSGIQLDDAGNVTGVEDAVKKLLEERPYLVSDKRPPTVGSPSNPANGTTQLRRFKLSELQDTRFYKEHRAEINEAQKRGLIENDLKR